MKIQTESAKDTEYKHALQTAMQMMEEELDISPLIMMGFITDHNLVVQHTLLTGNILYYKETEIIGKPFTHFLHPDAVRDWETLPAVQNGQSLTSQLVKLYFMTKQGFVSPSYCYVSRLGKDQVLTIAIYSLMLNPAATNALNQKVHDLKNRILDEDAPENTPFSIYDAQLEKVRAYITKHIDQHFTVQDLEIEGAMSRCTLQQKFKARHGTTIHDFVTCTRIIRACEMLRRNRSLKHTARAVGYGLYGFIRVFKKYMGCTPGEYQKLSSPYKDALDQLKKRISERAMD